MEISPESTADHLRAHFWNEAPKEDIKSAALEMRTGGKTDHNKADLIFAALEAPAASESYKLYQSMFFTKAGTPNASMVTAKAGPTALHIFGDKKTGPQSEALRMIEARSKVNAAHILDLTRAIYILSIDAVRRYRAVKQRRRVMDFDDQIHLSHSLLTDQPARDWVKYKLDGGVDHILVDEAQDTSDAQWEIIDALSEEFFQPAPDRDDPLSRTLFAVGDEKQSIYSFQGARPEVFLQKIDQLKTKQTRTPDVRMSMSFRSSPEILQMVDQIFFKDGGIHESFDGVIDGQGAHEASRVDTGLIEFWPASKASVESIEEIVWKPEPVDAPSTQSTREQLAREIAKQIKDWIKNGEPVFDRDLQATRPMQAKDIMILVTKRLPFFDAIIRNLKDVGVPVAGADRLMLTDSIAVQDLLSLAKFTQLQSDDLSLAEVLKSPLIGWSEEELFQVAHGRDGESLWQVLPDGRDKSILTRLLGLASRTAPYEFFARTLAVTSNGESLLKKMYNRVGIEAADAIEAFLARALSHQRRGAPSMARFISEIENDDNKIKREMDTAQNEVRVMTVHAAKGLEAPVVILPDTTTLPTVNKEKLFPFENGFSIGGTKAERPKIVQDIVDDALAARLREHMRLLYVALTRAEARLLVCGFESRNKVAEGSWHDRVGAALLGLSRVETISTPFGDGLSFGDRAAPQKATVKPTIVKVELPSFLSKPFQKETISTQRVSPSRLVADGEFDVPVRSPLDAQGKGELGRFGRGNIIHKLLQILPDLPEAERRSAAQNYLSKQPQEIARQIETEVFDVLDTPEFAPFFAHGSQAEVALAGKSPLFPDHIELNGQIDRLCVQGDKVWIIDYKSNRPPPAHEQDVPEIYIRQMAAYRALVQDLYPDKTVVCALLWTDGPRFMPLSDTVLDNVNWETVLTA